MALGIAINDNFQRSGFDLISCHSPLVLDVVVVKNVSTPMASGDTTVDIQGQAPADNITTYTFNMGYVSTVETLTGFEWSNYFKLDITDIIRNICNDPDLRNEVGASWFRPSRLATDITITVKSSGESDEILTNTYMHGFNQVNNPDSSCLVDYADKDIEAIIPIVPGVPMMYLLWQSSNQAGLHQALFVKVPSSTIGTINISPSIVKGLYQFYHVTQFGLNVYNAFVEPISTYTVETRDTATMTLKAKLTMIAFRKACKGDVVLCWLNRYGIYSYMSFERFPTHRGKQKHIGSYDLEVYDIANLQGRKKSRGYKDVHKVIISVARGVPTEYFSVIEDLFYSMDVYYFTGTLPKYEHDDAEWLRVTVRGELIEINKRDFENVRIDIMLPDKYTQLR